MLLVPIDAPLESTLARVIEAQRRAGANVAIDRTMLPRVVAICAVGDADALDDSLDPTVDLGALSRAIIDAGVSDRAAPVLAEAIVRRDDVLDLAGSPALDRPLTLFELRALLDVVGPELGALLPAQRVRVDRALLAGAGPRRALNHCMIEHDGVARIRLVDTNGVTLGARTHALVHELGHALIGIARRSGRSYAAAYGDADYGRFLDPSTNDRPCDEEALVRAIADAWLLRRPGVTWARTWPGAIDDAGTKLNADDLAAWARFRLAQGLGQAATPVRVRRVG